MTRCNHHSDCLAADRAAMNRGQLGGLIHCHDPACDAPTAERCDTINPRRSTIRKTTGTVTEEADIVLGERCVKVSLRWLHLDGPGVRAVFVQREGQVIEHPIVVLQPDETLVLRSHTIAQGEPITLPVTFEDPG